MTEQDSNTEYAPDDFHLIPVAYNILVHAVREANPQAFQKSANTLDESPSMVLRGLVYASHALSRLPSDESPEQMSLAIRAIAEMTELIVCLMEHKNTANFDKYCAEHSQ